MRKHLSIYKINCFLIVLFSSLSCIPGLKAQSSYKVLFLGNSYIYVNDLPQLIHDVASSVGDTLFFDSHTPGGYTLEDHSQDATSQTKIMAGVWDYVVIQGQSQEPIMSDIQFENGFLALSGQVKHYNPCAVTMPYITWGRKNGDAANCPGYPQMCTYQGMDTAIRNRYLYLTASINGEASPVSVVWNYLRQNYPALELYQADESHPSIAGSYAAACCFYASIFKKDPSLITYDFGLNATDAAIIRNAAKTKVFDILPSWDFKKLPNSNFVYEIGPGINNVVFHPLPMGAGQTYFWDFGDGDTTSAIAPTHPYAANGTYTVSLTTTNCNLQGLHTSFTDTVIQFCPHTPTIYTTHPWVCEHDTLWTEPADSYQWLYGAALPETNQYILNYPYHTSGFSVISTINGCAELSQTYTGSPIWSGYYFDGIGNPCVGDTVAFAVLHINGSLPGSEIIQWYKNDTLLSSMTNEDTLLITTAGKYECKVIDPTSNCPLDTTFAILQYDCSETSIEEKKQELGWTLYPNPTSENITLQFTKYPIQETIEIYSVIGRLIRSIKVPAATTQLPIADLPNGLYYARLKNKKGPALKFIKL